MTAPAVRRHIVPTRHGHMHVRTAGEGGTPVVLLHSMVLGGGGWFRHVLPLLATDRRVIAPDRIGHGESDPQPSQLTIPEFADATMDALDELGIATFDLGGIHTGGIEAVEIATTRPARVRKLVAVPVSLWTDEQIAGTKAAVGPPPEPVEDGSHLLWYWKSRMNLRPPDVPLEEVQSWMIDQLRGAPNSWWVYEGALDYPMAERLPAITQPFLVIAPHDDTFEAAQRAREILPGHAEFVELDAPDVMSVITSSAPALVELMRDFYDR